MAQASPVGSRANDDDVFEIRIHVSFGVVDATPLLKKSSVCSCENFPGRRARDPSSRQAKTLEELGCLRTYWERHGKTAASLDDRPR